MFLDAYFFTCLFCKCTQGQGKITGRGKFYKKGLNGLKNMGLKSAFIFLFKKLGNPKYINYNKIF